MDYLTNPGMSEQLKVFFTSADENFKEPHLDLHAKFTISMSGKSVPRVVTE